MEELIENLLSYLVAIFIVGFTLTIYTKNRKRYDKSTQIKIEKAKEFGLFEPVTLHPVINKNMCIGSGACIAACPEKDILGLMNGRVLTINASRCVGHGACFHACPVQAITLCIGTERRGVELPHISQEFETNITNLFIAGELGGMGLIKNAVEQGKQAIDNLSKRIGCTQEGDYDVIIVGAGPAGISATLQAKKLGLKFLTIEQDSLGGSVYHFPRAKVVMTSPMNLPLKGKIKLTETSKAELLELWNSVLVENNIIINEQEKVKGIEKPNGHFIVTTNKGSYTSKGVLFAIGRGGTPRKLGVPGEEKEKVAYRLLAPEQIHDKNILVVGGGDSAIESALILSEDNNKVSLSYRKDKFSRIKPKNLENITKALNNGKVEVIFNSNVKVILDEFVVLNKENESELKIENDLVYVFAGGELPTSFLEKTGIKITKKFGDAILEHK